MKASVNSTAARSQMRPADRFFTVSNLLSLLRLLLTIPFAVVMLSGSPAARLWGAVIMVVAALTDKYDGALARKYDQTTEWGKILDPVADKIGVAVVAVVLLVLGNIPAWFFIALVARDILIFSGGVYVRSRRAVIPQSNEVGKWTVGIVAMALFLMVLNAQSTMVAALTWAATVLLAVSFALYVKRFADILKELRNGFSGQDRVHPPEGRAGQDP